MALKTIKTVQRKITVITFILVASISLAEGPPTETQPETAAPKTTSPLLSTNEAEDIKRKLQSLEDSIDKVDAELQVLKAQSTQVIQRAYLSYLNQFYLRLALAMVVPRKFTFPFSTDTGLGLSGGFGKYFGRYNVLDIGGEWDVYPSISFRYRLEFHLDTPSIAFGPVVGYKTKLFNVKPWDNFISEPQAVKPNFWFAGLLLGFPLVKSLATIEVLYLKNQQEMILVNMGIQFFLL